LIEVLDKKEKVQEEKVTVQLTEEKTPLFKKFLSLLSKNKS